MMKRTMRTANSEYCRFMVLSLICRGLLLLDLAGKDAGGRADGAELGITGVLTEAWCSNEVGIT